MHYQTINENHRQKWFTSYQCWLSLFLFFISVKCWYALNFEHHADGIKSDLCVALPEQHRFINSLNPNYKIYYTDQSVFRVRSSLLCMINICIIIYYSPHFSFLLYKFSFTSESRHFFYSNIPWYLTFTMC